MFGSRGRVAAGLAAVLSIVFATVVAAESTWPREISTDHGILTIYQPQPEKLQGNILHARAAASLLAKSATEPTFGVFWFTARLDTDRDAGTTTLRDFTVTRVKWPESQESEERAVAEFLTSLMPKKAIPLSLERLKASLITAESERASLSGLKSDPPKVLVVEELAELLQYDGEPQGVPIGDSKLEHIANAPFAVVRDTRNGTCYLSGGKLWYSAKDPKGPWSPISKPPEEVARLVPPDTSSAPAPAKPPRIVVATEPTELIATDGPPAWKPIGKGELMYIGNTESSVVREVSTGDIFLLASGRWYRSRGLAGPWAVVRPDQLPVSFQEIPPASDLGTVRVSVAGTPEAEEAMLDAEVPQTAAIDREKAKLEVEYSGEPTFESIPGTGVEYATNTAAQVLRIGGKYYACDDGVWFQASKATGPWTVADSVPTEEIQKIPPSEPVYNVTHVTIYESTPRVVYVGYTPGYLWSFPWYGCPVYGTGWYYRPYWGPRHYYPRPATYGVHAGYNPWTGWTFGFSYSTGFMRIGMSFGGGYGGYFRPGYRPGYWRPPGFYPPGGHRPPYYPPGHRPGYRPPYRPRPTLYASRPGGAKPSQPRPSNNLYRDRSNRDRVASAAMQRESGLEKANRVAKGPNNVFADRNGRVHRETPKGWESRDQGRWSPASPSARPAQPSAPGERPGASIRPSRPSTRPAQPSVRPSEPRPRPSAPAGLDRDARARQQGASRSRMGPSRTPTRPSPQGGIRSGGRRR